LFTSLRTVTQALTRASLIFRYLLIAPKFLEQIPRYCERKYEQER